MRSRALPPAGMLMRDLYGSKKWLTPSADGLQRAVGDRIRLAAARSLGSICRFMSAKPCQGLKVIANDVNVRSKPVQLIGVYSTS